MSKQTITTAKTSLSANIRHVTLLAMLFSVAIVLSVVESYIPMPGPPGVKLGLSNIVVLFMLLSVSKFDAVLLVLLKGLFAFITRGFTASVMSLFGGLFSILVMIVLLLLFKNRISLLILSISGALFHNIGQLLAASWLMGTLFISYLPVLLLAGLAAGFITSVILKITLPALKKSKFKFTI